MNGEYDQFLKAQPQLVEKTLSGATTTLVTLTESGGPARTLTQWPGVKGPPGDVRLAGRHPRRVIHTPAHYGTRRNR
jgi:hypothetical protein